MPKSGGGGGFGGGGLGFIIPGPPRGRRQGRGKRRGGGRFGRFRLPRFRIGNLNIRFRGLRRILVTPSGGPAATSGAPSPPHPLHFASPGVPAVIAEICAVNPAQCVGSAAVSPLVGVAALGAAAFLLAQNKLQDLILRRMQDELDEEERELEELRKQRRARQAASEPTVAPLPELLPFYDYPILPPLRARPARPQRVETAPVFRPERVNFPEISPPAPEIFPEIFRPAPPKISEILPKISPVPALPVDFPVEFSRPVAPGASEFLQPLDFFELSPGQVPGISAPGDFLPDVPGIGLDDFLQSPDLTPFNPTGVPSLSIAPDISPKTGRAKCECPTTDTKTKRRKKRGDCEKGFYEERGDKTSFTAWKKIDCTTGKEIR